MSDVINKTNNKEPKMVKFDRYLAAVTLDGQVTESFAVEGADGTDDAIDRFLNWYLIFRSSFFPTLVRADIDDVKDSLVKVDLPEDAVSVARYRIEIPVKTKTGKVKSNIKLEVTFSKFQFGMLLN